MAVQPSPSYLYFRRRETGTILRPAGCAVHLYSWQYDFEQRQIPIGKKNRIAGVGMRLQACIEASSNQREFFR